MWLKMMNNEINLSKEFKNKFIDEVGIVVYHGDELYNLLLNGKSIEVEVDNSPDIELYNNIMEKYGLDTKKIECYSNDHDYTIFHNERINEWNMPISYLNIDLLDYFQKFDLTPEEEERVAAELFYFEKYNCYDVLRFLIYLIDVMAEHDLVWGVGRGSSVASLCLYLIGVHKIHPLKYGLDMDEFFKEV